MKCAYTFRHTLLPDSLQELYRKDCNLAAQLLQCSKSHYRAHKMSEVSCPTAAAAAAASAC